MNDDERLTSYFRSQADRLPVPDRDPASVPGIHARIRSRRLVTLTAAAAFVVVAAVAVAALPTSPATTEAGSPGAGEAPDPGSSPAPAAPPLHWTGVDVPGGIAHAFMTTVADDGSVYAISTAPGAFDPANQGSRIYRTTDARTWAEEALPGQLSPSLLEASGGSIYAVGTSPAGGGLTVATKAGAGGWSAASIPYPHAELIARRPKEVSVTNTAVASGPNGVIAAVTVKSSPDIKAELDARGLWKINNVTPSATGVTVTCAVDMPDQRGSVPPRPAGSVPPGSAPSGSVPPPLPPDRCESGKVFTFTWDELGVDPELRPLALGETHLYRSTGGGAYTEIPAPALPKGSVQAIFGTARGYRLLITSESLGSANGPAGKLAQLRSADGITWESSGPVLDVNSFALDKGVLGGRPTVAYFASDLRVQLVSADDAGVWSSRDLALGPLGVTPNASPGFVTIGPMGLAAVVVPDGSLRPDGRIVTSPDGVQVSSAPLAPLIGDGPWVPAGITVNADATVLRLTRPDTDGITGGRPDPAQRLLVGTPS